MKARRAAENYADEDDGAGGDVLPKSSDMQENQCLLQRAEQQDSEECSEQAAAASQNICATENDGGDDGEFVTIRGIALYSAELCGVKNRADGGQQAERDIREVDRSPNGNAGACRG